MRSTAIECTTIRSFRLGVLNKLLEQQQQQQHYPRSPAADQTGSFRRNIRRSRIGYDTRRDATKLEERHCELSDAPLAMVRWKEAKSASSMARSRELLMDAGVDDTGARGVGAYA